MQGHEAMNGFDWRIKHTLQLKTNGDYSERIIDRAINAVEKGTGTFQISPLS
jgi:hypothetical protein